jgi:hypothetical protein
MKNHEKPLSELAGRSSIVGEKMKMLYYELWNL